MLQSDELAAIVARIREGGRRRREWDQLAQPAQTVAQRPRARAGNRPRDTRAMEAAKVSWGRLLASNLALPPSNWGRA